MCSDYSAFLQAVLPVTNKTEHRLNDANQNIHNAHFLRHSSHKKWPATGLKVCYHELVMVMVFIINFCIHTPP